MKKVSGITVITLLLYCILMALCAICDISIYSIILLSVWVFMMWYSLMDIHQRVILFTFGFSFFNFLLGREFLERFFGYQIEDFSNRIVLHSEICIIVSLITLTTSYIYFEKRNEKHTALLWTSDLNKKDERVIQNVSEIFFEGCVFCAIMYNCIIGLYVLRSGYYGSYTSAALSSLYHNPIIYLLEKTDQMTPVFFAIFLASMPKKQCCQKNIILFLGYIVTSLASGQRATFVIGLFWLFIYFIYRNHKNGEIWIEKKHVVMIIVALPIGIIFLGLVSKIRDGGVASVTDVLKVIPDYFYQQGVSINVLKRSYQYADLFPSKKFYSMSFITEGILGKILGFPSFTGNSIEHAKEGYSMAHTLSYIVLGNKYLQGIGIGSSYIAELYYDFKYVGIIAGNVLYGYLLAKLGSISLKNIYCKAAIFLVIRQLLWSPRSGFSEFISIFFQPFTLLAFLITILGTYFVRYNKNFVVIAKR